ncbi:MAG: GSCFA domain-containing protein [Bacteroidota bacterium]|nr:GSCFA domain-containing protein [Bacteroidota bacterium]
MNRTEIQTNANPIIGLETKVLTIGSCFADNIGERLHADKLQTVVNPFGTVYNPISIFELLEASLLGGEPSEVLYYHDGETWQHHGFHSMYWNFDKEKLTHQLQKILTDTGNFLREANVLMITFGTSVIYKLASNETLVNNCHKRPAKDFEQDILELHAMEKAFAVLYKIVKEENPKLKIILTLSPVRHLKDGLELNAISKSLLRVLCSKLANEKDILYFPAYETMLDDLRDYSYYKEDLLHPNDRAIDYIYHKFGEQYFTADYHTFIHKWQKFKLQLAHRPLKPGTKQHLKFLQNLYSDLQLLNQTVDVKNELEEVNVLMKVY